VKHIKPFNESKENLVEDLQDFCDTSLAYLYDEGYNVSLSIRDQVKYPGVNHIVVSLGLPNENYVALRPYDGYRKFHWNDVKDYYIPFLQMLQRRYELQSYLGDTGYVCFNDEMGFRYLSLDKVINDRVGSEVGSRLWGINLKIVDKI
jgi:hypothetical protein